MRQGHHEILYTELHQLLFVLPKGFQHVRKEQPAEAVSLPTASQCSPHIINADFLLYYSYLFFWVKLKRSSGFQPVYAIQ